MLLLCLSKGILPPGNPDKTVRPAALQQREAHHVPHPLQYCEQQQPNCCVQTLSPGLATVLLRVTNSTSAAEQKGGRPLHGQDKTEEFCSGKAEAAGLSYKQLNQSIKAKERRVDGEENPRWSAQQRPPPPHRARQFPYSQVHLRNDWKETNYKGEEEELFQGEPEGQRVAGLVS